MPNTRSLIEAPKLKILLVSAPGRGKTTMAGTAREAFGPMYAFDFDLQIETLAGLDIDYDQYPEGDPKTYKRAIAKLDELAKANPYEVVLCDGLTYLGKATMRYAMPLTKSFMPNMTRIGDGQIEVPGGKEGADYGTQMTFVEEFLAKLRKLNCHIICTAHEKIVTDDAGRVLEVTIAMTGQLAGRIPGMFGEHYQMVVTNTADTNGNRISVFRAQTAPDNLRGAKTKFRAGRVLQVKRGDKIESVTIKSGLGSMEEPDFGRIYPKVLAHIREVAEATKDTTKLIEGGPQA